MDISLYRDKSQLKAGPIRKRKAARASKQVTPSKKVKKNTKTGHTSNPRKRHASVESSNQSKEVINQ